MYKLSVPVMVGNFPRCGGKEKYLEELKRIGAERVFLALGGVPANKEQEEAEIKIIKENAKYFQDNGLEVGTWTKPMGGYFVSFDSLDGCAKKIVAMCKEAGVVMTGAGATFPYGKDPKDSNIRIAPSFPSLEELKLAAEIFCVCVKLVSIDKLLEA